MNNKVTYLSPLGKEILQAYVRRHWDHENEKLPEWRAFEIIMEGCAPDLFEAAQKRLKKFPDLSTGEKTPSPDED